ncbi:MAG: 3-oxoacyl-ACP reductase FabG [Thermoplasmata archaeon]|nr:MAG: 3-oxoacyl-ACP reductase FabG [Thermoplasmata archaeon]
MAGKSNDDLSGKVAIVTGGSIGIGASIAFALAEAGADVALNYRKHSEEAEAVVLKINEIGRRGLVVQADVSNFRDAENMVTRVKEELGSVDILVCNAGITRDAVIWKMTEEQWDEVININLKGYFNYIHAVGPIFKSQNSGKIVNVASINGLRGKFGQSNYAATKGGIIALTKTIARELGKFNVNVNAIAPGMVLTNMMEKIPDEFKQRAVDETVLGRLASPEDIANLVVFLCSDRSRHITGEVIKIDGGQYI